MNAIASSLPSERPQPLPKSGEPVKPEPRGNLFSDHVLPLTATLVVVGLAGYVATDWSRWAGIAPVQVTDDAQIRADTSRLAARIAGVVQSVAVRDFQHVRAGDLLVEIDPADYVVAVAQADAGLAASKATLANLDNQIGLQRATILQAESEHSSAIARELQARLELERQQSLLPTGSGTQQKAEQAVAAAAVAQSSLRSAEAAIVAQQQQLKVLFGTKKQREAELEASHSALLAAKLRLSYTRIVAPFDGVVGERQAQVGNYVAAGANVIALVPLPNVHVIANYKETQLPNVAPGQVASVTVDSLPGRVFQGHVERIAPASGSQFALLPPDNATGNFTKVVQRIPVRIVLDADQPELERLRPGMSVISRIRTDQKALSTANLP